MRRHPESSYVDVPGRIDDGGGTDIAARVSAQKLTEAFGIVAVMRVPAAREKMPTRGFEPVGDTPEEFAKFPRKEIARWEKLVKTAGIEPEQDAA